MKMLYEEKYTIDGAKRKLKEGTADSDARSSAECKDIKTELIDILKILS